MASIHHRFHKDNFYPLCNKVAALDPDLENIIREYGYPPLWIRPNSFETLVLTILEQQVSLASANAAYKKLKEKIQTVTPAAFLSLTEATLRICYFSRQKIRYTRGLANALIEEQLDLQKFYEWEDHAVRSELKKHPGIGDWTVDIYLIHALQRTNIFPIGDLALVNAVKMVKDLPVTTGKKDILQLSTLWQPYRTIATMLFWHYYIKKKNIRMPV